MKLAILGGSFNPLHISHAMLAETAVTQLGYDKVLFIPTFVPPHKELSGGITAKQRLAMVKLFCESEGRGRFELETCEIDRGGVSYTYDTLCYLLEKYKGQLEGKPALLMGEEIAAQFSKWKNAEAVAQMADLIISPRYPDYYSSTHRSAVNKASGHYSGDFEVSFDVQKFGFPCRVLEEPMLPISSTEIRERAATGKSFRYLVPPAVFDYIIENKLYD